MAIYWDALRNVLTRISTSIWTKNIWNGVVDLLIRWYADMRRWGKRPKTYRLQYAISSLRFRDLFQPSAGHDGHPQFHQRSEYPPPTPRPRPRGRRHWNCERVWHWTRSGRGSLCGREFANRESGGEFFCSPPAWQVRCQKCWEIPPNNFTKWPWNIGLIISSHFQGGSILKSSSGTSVALQICTLSKDDLAPSKDSKFSSGIHVSCPYLGCSMKNSQFQHMGRFPAGLVKVNRRHSCSIGDIFRVPAEPPPLQSQAPQIQRRLPWPDHGGAPTWLRSH